MKWCKSAGREKGEAWKGIYIKLVQAVEWTADLLANCHDEAHISEAALATAQTLHVCHCLSLVFACLDLSNAEDKWQTNPWSHLPPKVYDQVLMVEKPCQSWKNAALACLGR